MSLKTPFNPMGASKMVRLTIIPQPSNATVTLTCSGYTQSGNSILVKRGSAVTYTVSASEYTTITNTVYPQVTQSINVNLVYHPYNTNQVILETNSGSGSVTLKIGGTYEVICVGGGGGGGHATGVSGNVVNGSGGSGGKWQGTVSLSAGRYTYSVGNGGSGGSWAIVGGGYTAGGGSATSIYKDGTSLMIASYGGGGCYCYTDIYGYVHANNGGNGSVNNRMSVVSTGSYTGSRGSGGTGNQAGTGGYIKIVYKS